MVRDFMADHVSASEVEDFQALVQDKLTELDFNAADGPLAAATSSPRSRPTVADPTTTGSNTDGEDLFMPTQSPNLVSSAVAQLRAKRQYRKAAPGNPHKLPILLCAMPHTTSSTLITP